MTKLKSVLISKGISGKEFAAMSNLSCSTIYKYMSNDRPLSEKTAKRLAAVLNIDFRELMS